MSIKLYQFESCPYCRRVRVALEAKGIDYEKIEVPLYRSERKELFALSGQYQVPVLIYGDKVISDSATIIEYLDREF